MANAEDKKSSLNATDEKFVKKTAQDGMAEVKLAGLGVQKAERADVKAFAEQMVKDHTAANDELKALAATKGVELSAIIDPSAAKTFKSLEGQSGAAFDKDFIKDMEKDHKSAVSSFEKEEKNAADGDLKTWVSKTLPTLRSHLDHVKGLNK
jgi:putative membrane protein